LRCHADGDGGNYRRCKSGVDAMVNQPRTMHI
jgi:hypothetical protein